MCAGEHKRPREPDVNTADRVTILPAKALIASEHQDIHITHEAIASPAQWFNPEGVKLVKERWEFWANVLKLPCPLAAQAPVQWQLLEQPAQAEVANHTSALEHVKLLEEELQKALDLGLIEYLPPGVPVLDFVLCINPFGVRVKANGRARVLVDPTASGVNAAMRHLPMSLTSPEEFFAQVDRTDVLGKRDLVNGFYHVSLAPEARRLMGFRHPSTGRIGRWVALPQGTAQSPAYFCEVTNFSAKIFNWLFKEAAIEAFVDVFVDDYPLKAANHPYMIKAFEVMDAEAALLGLSFNPAKDAGREQALTALEVLGLLIDALKHTMHLSVSKQAAYLQEVRDLLQSVPIGNRFPRKQLEQLIGKLLWACKCCRWGKLFVQSALDVAYPTRIGMQAHARFARTTTVTMSEALHEDLLMWAHILQASGSAWMGLKRALLMTRKVFIVERNFPVHLYIDASKVFGAGGVKANEVVSIPWSEDRSADHIGTLELEAFVLMVEAWLHDLKGSMLLGHLDNVQAVIAINKGSSRLPAVRQLLRRLAMLGIQHGFEVRAQYVKGELNYADAPSRGLIESTEHESMFRFFAKFNEPACEIDCCSAVDGHNVQPGCTSWFSTGAPMQAHADMLQGKVSWACVPFSDMTEIVNALVGAWKQAPLTTTITALVPEWRDTTWYRKYVGGKRPVFAVLKRYDQGTRLFMHAITHRVLGPCSCPMLVIRLGGNTLDSQV